MNAPARAPVGPLRFARYALAPNSLGYCGPEDSAELAGALSEADTGAAALLAPWFSAAFPYLRLIASWSGIADPLDSRVVTAYWLGGPLLRRIPPTVLAAHLEERFATGIRRFDDSLAAAALAGGVASHSLHVLGATPFGALVRSGAAGPALEVCDRCRIRPARVLAAKGGGAVVAVRPLVIIGGRLGLGAARSESVRYDLSRLDSPSLGIGDVVSLHWDFVCEHLDPPALGALVESTAANLAAVNACAHPAPFVAADALGG